MEADFDRFYGRDLATTIWVDHWPPSMIWSRILGLPEDSAFGRTIHHGHTNLHELLAQVRDAVVTSAHGYRLEGRPRSYERPGGANDPQDGDVLDPTNPAHANALRRFFGNPR